MSTQTSPEQAAMESIVAGAADAMREQVQMPVFFHKLASYGITPRTEEEAQELWNIGCKLSYADRARATEPEQSAIKAASADLDAFLGSNVDNANQLSSQLVNANPDLLKAAYIVACAEQ